MNEEYCAIYEESIAFAMTFQTDAFAAISLTRYQLAVLLSSFVPEPALGELVTNDIFDPCSEKISFDVVDVTTDDKWCPTTNYCHLPKTIFVCVPQTATVMKSERTTLRLLPK